MAKKKLAFGSNDFSRLQWRRPWPHPSLRRSYGVVDTTCFFPRGDINEYAKIDDTSSHYVFYDLR